MKRVMQFLLMLLITGLIIRQGYPVVYGASHLAGTHPDETPSFTLFTPGEFFLAGERPVKNLEKVPGFTFKRTVIDLKDILHHSHLLFFLRLQEYPVFTGETIIGYRKTSRTYPFHAFW